MPKGALDQGLAVGQEKQIERFVQSLRFLTGHSGETVQFILACHGLWVLALD
jgi:hypothetical protein